MLKLLIVQARHPSDPMIGHEVQCIRTRLGDRPLSVSVRNAYTDEAGPEWLDGVDGFMIGGSGEYSVHHPDSQSWLAPVHRLLHRALNEGVFGLGICFGHQLLGQHLGSEVVTDPAHAEMGTVEVELTEAGQESGLFRGISSPLWVHTGHSDAVVSVPENVSLLARNQTLSTQAFHVTGTGFYSIQFHPDMTGQDARDRYLAYREVFEKKADIDAFQEAEKFHLGRDESCRLLGNWADLLLVSRR